MIEATAKFVLDGAQGRLLSGTESDSFRGISIDSRTLDSQSVFICIRGERMDGHDFLEDVYRKEPAGIVLSDPGKIPADWKSSERQTPFVVQVEDTLKALQDLAQFHRNRMPARVVAVTGTNGKSTTKEMIAALAQTQFRTHKNKGNFNNHIGVPLTLFGLTPEHETAILEMGMSDAGEIRRLAEIARPDIGVITNISQAHMERLKTVRDVQAAKGELFEALGPEQTAVVNADDPLILEIAQTLRARKITFGIHNQADVKADSIQKKNGKGFDVQISLFDKKLSLPLSMPGRFNVYNALAAVAAGHSLGVPAENMAQGLSNVSRLEQRGRVSQVAGMTLINDAYNANPQSMQAALEMLTDYPADGNKFAVLGEMLELGNLSASAHVQLGEQVAQKSIDGLVAVGTYAPQMVEAAIRSGINPALAVAVSSHEEAIETLSRLAKKGDCFLFKGSRGARMEIVFEGFASCKGEG